MENKENVCEQKISTTEQVGKEKVELGSAVMGKFKSVDALERAYNALQAEFTRRSQRLKELERAIKDGNTDNSQEQNGALGAGVEKLRATAAKRRDEGKKFDEFLSNIENRFEDTQDGRLGENPIPEKERTADFSESGTDAPLTGVDEDDDGKAGLELKTNNVSESDLESACGFGTGETTFASVDAKPNLSSDALYEAVSKDEKARMRIIGDYLSSLRRSGAPLMKGGGGMTVAPQVKAKSISDAGLMALRFFQKEEL